MNSSPAEIVRAIYAELSVGDLDAVFARAAPDFTAEFSRSLANRGVFRGRGECEGAYRRFSEAWSELRWEVEEIEAISPAILVAHVVFVARGGGSGVETTARGGHVWLFNPDGLAREWQLYQSVPEATESARRQAADRAAERGETSVR